MRHDAYLFQNRSSLFLRTVFKDSLNDSAPIRVHTQTVHMFYHWLYDELYTLMWHFLYTLLYDMVSILVMNAVKHSIFEFTN